MSWSSEGEKALEGVGDIAVSTLARLVGLSNAEVALRFDLDVGERGGGSAPRAGFFLRSFC